MNSDAGERDKYEIISLINPTFISKAEFILEGLEIHWGLQKVLLKIKYLQFSTLKKNCIEYPGKYLGNYFRNLLKRKET